MPRIQTKRGVKSALPTTGMLAGELMVTTDQGTLHVATAATTSLPVVPAIDDLTAIGAVAGSTDLLLIHDASEASAQKAKKITFADFKTALSIPPESTDEKFAVVSGGTAGYPWGADGTDGVIRLHSSLSWTLDASNNFVTLSAATIDCGSFA